MDRSDKRILAIAVAMNIVVVAAALVATISAGFGSDDDHMTPQVAITREIAGNRCALMIMGVTHNDVLYTGMGIRVVLPDYTRTTWNLSDATWVGNTTEHYDANLDCWLSFTKNEASSESPYLRASDAIAIEAVDGLDTGYWTISIYYAPTGGFMYSSTFPIP